MGDNPVSEYSKYLGSYPAKKEFFKSVNFKSFLNPSSPLFLALIALITLIISSFLGLFLYQYYFSPKAQAGYSLTVKPASLPIPLALLNHPALSDFTIDINGVVTKKENDALFIKPVTNNAPELKIDINPDTAFTLDVSSPKTRTRVATTAAFLMKDVSEKDTIYGEVKIIKISPSWALLGKNLNVK